MSDTLTAAPALGQPNYSGLVRGLRRDGRAIALVFALLAVWGAGVMWLYNVIDGPGVEASDRATIFAIKMSVRIAIFMFFWMVISLVRTTLATKDGSVIAVISRAAQNDPWRPARFLIALVLAIASFVWLQTNFMSVKTTIPTLQPFYMDEMFRDWDKALFLGRDPWTLFAWIYDIPALFKLIDNLYTYWAAFVAGFWVYAFCGERMSAARRMQYLIAMVLLWLIAGNFMATLLSSAGPCYFGAFTGDEQYYAPLMAKLAAMHEVQFVNAYDYQGMLMAMYENPNSRFGGISAAPSLHVGASFMMLLLFWKTRIARELLIAFNVLIYIGSIILAWHYAVDGLISIPVALAIWWASGKLSRRLVRD